MDKVVSIGIIGDKNPNSLSHAATTDALTCAAQSMNLPINIAWIPTRQLENDAETTLGQFHALWCAPGDPHLSLNGALEGVRFAREHDRPFIGTCMGFQVAALEYARNVIGIKDAQHAEYQPSAPNPFISPLGCSLTGQTMSVEIATDSKVFGYYGRERINEHYRCTFGMNRENQQLLDRYGFRIVGMDGNGDVRILELPNHPFFVATAFVPQMNLSEDGAHPLILAYLKAGMVHCFSTE